ncbi:pyruvate kinase [Candidatus Tachikawaea gelatinosa]|uniref:Pyruvate kinase n=1 Tax=Candidatus Tachikawaea gelatinosa TaxID=1410383 RepID=A0A090AS70_9ENTR|nr:pyruvate kinase [Candidatus Tachikawaea gelatinosa]BAP58710.1 pyruvate kinase [Candidatus Tachikawaea gelatinosa]
MLKRFRRTKIVTTLGPTTDSNNNLEKIIKAGANVVRINFSHGEKDDYYRYVKKVRNIAKKNEIYIAILGDLQGPKIRISSFKTGKIYLKNGNQFIIDPSINSIEGNENTVGTDYQDLPQDLKKDDVLLLDDGRIQLKVIKIENKKVFTKVKVGGFLSNKKGINKLGGGLSAEALTEKDKKDIITAAKIGVDYLAISFPRSSNDLNRARYLINQAGCFAKIIAKIERAEVVSSQKAIDDIILASDAIMVARGDLGVEIGDPELIGIQKTLISRARQFNRVIITATQMMESMIANPTPTRAEVMDVANAVLDGTDAVMLSAETATGEYPYETVSLMSKVCFGAEKIPKINISKHRLNITFKTVEEATAMSAMYTANHLQGISAIITMTESGKTALMTSRITSGLPIFALSRHEKTLNAVTLYRGVIPVFFDNHDDGLIAAKKAVHLLYKKNFLRFGDLVIVTQGDVMGTTGTTNINRILSVS